MTSSIPFPTAWCVEFYRELTAEEALKYTSKNPKEKFTFLCPSCRLPLKFHREIVGIKTRGCFHRRMGEYHSSCRTFNLVALPLSKKSRDFKAFEDFFLASEEAFKDFRYYLGMLNHKNRNLLEELENNVRCEEEDLLNALYETLASLKRNSLSTEENLRQIESIYLPLRLCLRGY